MMVELKYFMLKPVSTKKKEIIHRSIQLSIYTTIICLFHNVYLSEYSNIGKYFGVSNLCTDLCHILLR